MNFNRIIQILNEPSKFYWILIPALMVLIGMHEATTFLIHRSDINGTTLMELKKQYELASTSINRYHDLMELKEADVSKFKSGMSNTAQAKKMLFERGLSLQEEKRLLEKQWEIITTYLVI